MNLLKNFIAIILQFNYNFEILQFGSINYITFPFIERFSFFLAADISCLEKEYTIFTPGTILGELNVASIFSCLIQHVSSFLGKIKLCNDLLCIRNETL